MRNKKEIIATLLKAGRTDLANVIAHQVRANDHKYLGEDIWGKFAKVHVWRNALTVDEYPPGGKIRGKTARTLHYDFYLYANKDDGIKQVNDMLDELVKGAPVMPYDKLVAIVKLWADKISNGRGSENITERVQKAVNAPNPVAHEGTPKPQQNSKGVHIQFDERDRSITLKDTNDKFNEPTCYTKGPNAYKAALQTFSEWQDMTFSDIQNYWQKAGIRSHFYCAMD